MDSDDRASSLNANENGSDQGGIDDTGNPAQLNTGISSTTDSGIPGVSPASIVAANDQEPCTLTDELHQAIPIADSDVPNSASECKIDTHNNSTAHSTNGVRRKLITIAIAAVTCILVVGCAVLGRHFWAINHPVISDFGYDISDVSPYSQALLKKSFDKAHPLAATRDSDSMLHQTVTHESYFKVAKDLGAREVYTYKDHQLVTDHNLFYLLYRSSIQFVSTSPSFDKMARGEDGTPLKNYLGIMDSRTGDGVREYLLESAQLVFKSTIHEVSNYLDEIAGSSGDRILSTSQASYLTDDMTQKFNVSINEKGEPAGSYDRVFSTGRYYINIILDLAAGGAPKGEIIIVDKDAKQAQKAENPGERPFPGREVEDVHKGSSHASKGSKKGNEVQPGKVMSDQEYKQSQYNPKTALSKAYWSCTPQSKLQDFDFELTEQEHIVYMKGARDWSDSTVNRHTVTCLADNLGFPTQEIDGYIAKSMNESNPTQTLKYDNYSIIWQLTDSSLIFRIQD